MAENAGAGEHLQEGKTRNLSAKPGFSGTAVLQSEGTPCQISRRPIPARTRESGQRDETGQSLTAWCFLTQSGSKSTPNPGPVGTLIFPPTTCKGEVLHSNRTFVCSPLNS